MKEKLFVSAYACEPDKGSEIGVGWHWILEMSKQYELWVLTRKSNQKNIENWMNHYSEYPNIHFVYFDLPKKYTKWKKGMRGVRRYYVLWQKMSNKIVKKIMKENGIEIYHLLTYGNALWPASGYGMKKKFIWGPIGGLEGVSAEYVKDLSLKSRIIEHIRRMIVRFSFVNLGYRRRCKMADLIICKSENVKEHIPRKYQYKATVFTDVATALRDDYAFQKNKDLKFFAAGRMDGWRGFNLLINAFRKALEKNDKLTLEIAGEGIALFALKRMSKDLEEHVTFLGQISQNQYLEKLKDSDVVVNPVLREGGVTTVFDGIALGKPVICVDTKGYTNNFTKDYAVIIPKASRTVMEEKMAKAILEMADVERRKEMSQQAYEHAKELSWDRKGIEICELIGKMI